MSGSKDPCDDVNYRKAPAVVVEWFREQGGQYQTMINEVLRR